MLPVGLWQFSIADGAAHRLLVAENMRHIRIHSDGRRIAFVAGRFNAEIWVMENLLPPRPLDARR